MEDMGEGQRRVYRLQFAVYGLQFAVCGWRLAVDALVGFVLYIGYWLLAMREALPEASVLQGFHYLASEEHEQDRYRNDTENGAGH